MIGDNRQVCSERKDMRVQEGEENKQANTDKTKPHQAYLTHNKKAENNRKRHSLIIYSKGVVEERS